MVRISADRTTTFVQYRARGRGTAPALFRGLGRACALRFGGAAVRRAVAAFPSIRASCPDSGARRPASPGAATARRPVASRVSSEGFGLIGLRGPPACTTRSAMGNHRLEAPSPALRARRGQSACSVPLSWKKSRSARSRSLDPAGHAESGPWMARGGESARDGGPSRGAVPGRVEAGGRSPCAGSALTPSPDSYSRILARTKKPPGKARRRPGSVLAAAG